MNKYDDETKKRIAAAKKAAFEAEDPREEMRSIGNKLVQVTEQFLRKVGPFFKNFNKNFQFVKLDQFIFQEADYVDVAKKEVEEIASIFSKYDIIIDKISFQNNDVDVMTTEESQIPQMGIM